MGKKSRLRREQEEERLEVALFLKQHKKMVYKIMGEQFAEANKRFWRVEIACLLWALRKYAGWGKKKLLDFATSYRPLLEKVTEFYEVDYESEESSPIMATLLKEEVGIDVYSDEFQREVYE